MSKDPTFRVLGGLPTRSERYEAYRREWDRREAELDAADHPVHVDLETVAVCDLRCGSSEEDPQGFCQIWTHEHIRTQGFDEHTYQRGYMDPVLYGRLIQQCADMGVSARSSSTTAASRRCTRASSPSCARRPRSASPTS